MTSTCAQCSAFRFNGDRACGHHLPVSVSAKSPACIDLVNGWDIEWRESGLRWRMLLNDRVTYWALDSLIFGDSGRLEESGDGDGDVEGFVCQTGQQWEARESLMWGSRLLHRGALAECCRALIARVKGETDG